MPVATIYWERTGISSRTNAPFKSKLIMAADMNGNIIWSKNKYGGEPYLSAQVAPDRIVELLSNLDRASVLQPRKLDNSWCGLDSALISIAINYGENITRLESWHELFEEDKNLAVVNGNVLALENNESKEGAMSKASKEYNAFLHRWNLIRESLNALIPPTGKPYTGPLPAPLKEQNRN